VELNKMKMLFTITLVSAALLSSCASKKIYELSELKEIDKNAEKKCEFIKSFSLEYESLSENEVTRNLKVEVQKVGANAYSVSDLVNNGKMSKINGSAFVCNAK
jgi:hypothetical protein